MVRLLLGHDKPWKQPKPSQPKSTEHPPSPPSPPGAPSAPRRGSVALALAVAVAAALALPSPAAASPSAQADDAASLFTTMCAPCHTIGGGDGVGPDLAGVTARRERDWLLKWIAKPDEVLAANDPIALDLYEQFNRIAMPNLNLDPDQVELLVAYLEDIEAGNVPAPSAVSSVPSSVPPGDAANGRELFTGGVRLANGGPPCMSCHSVAGLGALGGGALGPDLTDAATKFGDVGLLSMLATVPLVTMNPIFGPEGDAPLTASEQADLLAFLQQADMAARPPDVLGQLLLLASAGTVLLFGLAHVTWRKRLLGVRKPMVKRSA